MAAFTSSAAAASSRAAAGRYSAVRLALLAAHPGLPEGHHRADPPAGRGSDPSVLLGLVLLIWGRDCIEVLGAYWFM